MYLCAFRSATNIGSYRFIINITIGRPRSGSTATVELHLWGDSIFQVKIHVKLRLPYKLRVPFLWLVSYCECDKLYQTKWTQDIRA